MQTLTEILDEGGRFQLSEESQRTLRTAIHRMIHQLLMGKGAGKCDVSL
jgi:hypothetical protein